LIFLVGTEVFVRLDPFHKPDLKKWRTTPVDKKAYDVTYGDGSVGYRTGRFVRLFPFVGADALAPGSLAPVLNVKVTDLANGDRIRPRVVMDEYSIKLAGLPLGKMSIELDWDLNPDNPPCYPGDFFSESVLVELKSGWVSRNIPVLEVMRLNAPFSNERAYGGGGIGSCQKGLVLEPGMAFGWESLGSGVSYHWRLVEVLCGSGWVSNPYVDWGTTLENQLTIYPPPVKPGTKFALFLEARRDGFAIAQLYVHEDGGSGPFLLFRNRVAANSGTVISAAQFE